MFKKLRNSMMLFNMLTISTVMLAAFAVIYMTTYMNIERENERKLDFVSSMLYPRGDAPNVGPDTPRHPQTGTPPLENAEERYRLVLQEISNSEKMLTELLLTLSAIAAGVLLIMALVCYRFAVRAVRPIEEGYNKQKRFIADASHELRTPLAVIGANVDAIASSGGETVDSQGEWFGYIRSELRQMGKLVDDLLYLANSDSIRNEADVSLPFDLSVVCERVCASMEAMLYDAGKSLKLSAQPDVIALGDEAKLTQALYILLDNAGKYTPKDGDISVKLMKEGERATVQVINSGEEISKEDLPKIFDRFYRADLSRSSKTGGAGLGLSIAKTIVENSGGTITASSGDGITVFEVKLRRVKNISNY